MIAAGTSYVPLAVGIGATGMVSLFTWLVLQVGAGREAQATTNEAVKGLLKDVARAEADIIRLEDEVFHPGQDRRKSP